MFMKVVKFESFYWKDFILSLNGMDRTIFKWTEKLVKPIVYYKSVIEVNVRIYYCLKKKLGCTFVIDIEAKSIFYFISLYVHNSGGTV